MGLSTAGLAFSSTPGNELEMIRRALGEDLHPVHAAEIRNFHDIRVPGNVSVESKNGAIFIYSGEIAERVLFKGEALEPALLSALGTPAVMVVFCHYDSGGSFGYAILENGVRVRSRVHTLDKTTEQGAPKEFELSWLQAEPFLDEDDETPAYRNITTNETATEAYVTAHMLNQTMKAFFGAAPWDDWNYKTKLNHYARKAASKAWWKFW